MTRLIIDTENRRVSHNDNAILLNGRQVRREEELETHELIAASFAMQADIDTILDAFRIER